MKPKSKNKLFLKLEYAKYNINIYLKLNQLTLCYIKSISREQFISLKIIVKTTSAKINLCNNL